MLLCLVTPSEKVNSELEFEWMFRYPQQRKYLRLQTHSVLFCWFRTPQFELKDGPRQTDHARNERTKEVLYRPVN